MPLDLARLENARQRGNRLTARCPACAETGSDRKGEHLAIFADGRFACVMNPGPAGEVHRQRIFDLAGIKEHPGQPARAPVIALQRPQPARPALHLPPLRRLTVGEMLAIIKLRGWPMDAGLELLTRRGLLWQGNVFDGGEHHPAWIVTDSARRNAQARRLDGQPWQGIKGAKAKSLPGSQASWPIGAPEIGARPFVMLCEGGPDFLAALLVAWFESERMAGFSVEHAAPVCLCGAGQTIPPDALDFFTGKHVRIFIHADDEGNAAAKRWAAQLYQARAKSVDGFDFAGLTRPDGQPVKDLADFAKLLDPEDPPVARALAGLATKAEAERFAALSS